MENVQWNSIQILDKMIEKTKLVEYKPHKYPRLSIAWVVAATHRLPYWWCYLFATSYPAFRVPFLWVLSSSLYTPWIKSNDFAATTANNERLSLFPISIERKFSAKRRNYSETVNSMCAMVYVFCCSCHLFWHTAHTRTHALIRRHNGQHQYGVSV